MKKKCMWMATTVVLSSSILFSSCLGSFAVTKRLYSWNKSIDSDPWVNELIFATLAIFQVYTVASLVDGLVLNSIEFWTGENPSEANNQVKEVKSGEDVYTITTNEEGHTIEKAGSDEIVAFRFNKAAHSWSLEAMGHTTPLVQFLEHNQALVYLADGSTVTVSRDQAGVLALKQIIANRTYYTSK
jgi:hypothetical protein